MHRLLAAASSGAKSTPPGGFEMVVNVERRTIAVTGITGNRPVPGRLTVRLLPSRASPSRLLKNVVGQAFQPVRPPGKAVPHVGPTFFNRLLGLGFSLPGVLAGVMMPPDSGGADPSRWPDARCSAATPSASRPVG